MNRHLKTGIFFMFILTTWATVHASGSLDLCKLLTREEVESLVGEPVKGPEQKDTKNPLGQKMCLYTTISSSRLIQLSVIRTADMEAGIRKQGQSAAKVYRSTKEMLDPLEQVPGVGDDACWGTPGLHILKGEMYILVTVGNTSKRENLDLARRVAEKVLSRL
jgi:hypothetical protein